MEQGVVIVGKCGDEQVHLSIIVHVAHRQAHVGLLNTLVVVGNSRCRSYLLEGSVTLVVIEVVWIGIVQDDDIGSAVAIEIFEGHSEPIVEPFVNHSCLGGHVGEGAIAVIMVQNVRSASKASRSADLDGLPAESAVELAALGRVVNIEVDVTADVEVQIPVIVVIGEGRSAAPDVATPDPGLDSDVGKRPVAVVPVQDVFPEIVDKEVDKAVVIVVGRHCSVPPARSFNARPQGHITEGAVAVVAKQIITGTISNGARVPKIGDRGAVCDIKVHISVVVVVKPHAAAPVYLEDVPLVRRPADQPGRDPGFGGHVTKGYVGARWGTAGRLRSL